MGLPVSCSVHWEQQAVVGPPVLRWGISPLLFHRQEQGQTTILTTISVFGRQGPQEPRRWQPACSRCQSNEYLLYFVALHPWLKTQSKELLHHLDTICWPCSLLPIPWAAPLCLPSSGLQGWWLSPWVAVIGGEVGLWV